MQRYYTLANTGEKIKYSQTWAIRMRVVRKSVKPYGDSEYN